MFKKKGIIWNNNQIPTKSHVELEKHSNTPLNLITQKFIVESMPVQVYQHVHLKTTWDLRKRHENVPYLGSNFHVLECVIGKCQHAVTMFNKNIGVPLEEEAPVVAVIVTSIPEKTCVLRA